MGLNNSVSYEIVIGERQQRTNERGVEMGEGGGEKKREGGTKERRGWRRTRVLGKKKCLLQTCTRRTEKKGVRRRAGGKEGFGGGEMWKKSGSRGYRNNQGSNFGEKRRRSRWRKVVQMGKRGARKQRGGMGRGDERLHH